MKSLKLVLFAVALFSFGLSMNSCGSKTASTEETTEAAAEETTTEEAATEAVDMSGPEYTSAYVCPMHCKGSGSAEAGKCPVCGMDYVANDSNIESKEEDIN